MSVYKLNTLHRHSTNMSLSGCLIELTESLELVTEQSKQHEEVANVMEESLVKQKQVGV